MIPSYMKAALRIGLFVLAVGSTAGAATNRYLFVGHPRAAGPGQIVQREVERIAFSRYDLLMLGGDYTISGTAARETVNYLDALFALRAPTTLASLGNHDTSHRSYFTDVSGRPTYYAVRTNGITFVVLDTTDDGQKILGAELQLLRDTVAALTNSTHLVLIHHHIIWLADYAPLSHLYGDTRIASSSATLSGLNFYTAVYPLLLQAVSNGTEVVCVAGDRTGDADEPFHIEHTTADGIHYLAAGFMEDAPANLRTAIEFEHDLGAGTLTWKFVPLADLPRIPDEPLTMTEIHYNPSAAQGDDAAFIELTNRGARPYDLSEAAFSAGVVCAFPTNTILAPGERILVAANPARYANAGVRVFDYDGAGLPVSGDPVWLRGRDYREIDYVDYRATAPWPSEPNGSGPTLMLIRPDLDNEQPENWAASDWNGGTPGELNFAATTCTEISVAGNRVFTDWAGTLGGAHYCLEWTPKLSPPEWQPAIEETEASNDTLSLSATNSASAGFFRLQRVFRALPPPVSATLIPLDATWRYRDTGTDPGPEWMSLTYDDSGWAAGAAELGYGDGDEATVVSYGPSSSSRYATTHFRYHFSVADPALLSDIRCNVKIDDGAIFYLNGTEVARVRMQAGAVTYQNYTTKGGSDYALEGIDLSATGFREGDNVLAVEVHQSSGTSSDISMAVELTVSVRTL